MLTTNADVIYEAIKQRKKAPLREIAKEADIPLPAATKIAHYLEQSNLIKLTFAHIPGPQAEFLKEPEVEFGNLDEEEIIKRLKFYRGVGDIKSANKLVMALYNYYLRIGDEEIRQIYEPVREYYTKNFVQETEEEVEPVKELEEYDYTVEDLLISVNIIKQPLEPAPTYLLSLLKVSDATQLVIERIKEEVVSKIIKHIQQQSREEQLTLRHKYEEHVYELMKEIFGNFDDEQLGGFVDYIIITSLGLGEVEFLLRDSNLEEIVINNANEPIRVYHKNHGWMQTNIIPENENKIQHYASLAGRTVDKTITTLQPLMDAHLDTGDRVNATLNPISTKGSTITIRKFAESPWTITDFLKSGTIDYQTAALIWTAIQYELSVLIVGGTGSGKTSALNVLSLFIMPNQRIVSIEDTRELRLPSTLHWVPLETRMANPEGKGEISMLDLTINALRMRPDRIIVGEIRRKKEAEVLFEAMHTGHSVYATLHANTTQEAIRRLTTDPIGISQTLLSALDLVIVQNRNRRTNQRRTFQVAEMDEEGNYNLLYEYDFEKDALTKTNAPEQIYKRLKIFSGLTKKEVDETIKEKEKILKYLVEEEIYRIEEIGQIISHYYTDKQYLMKKLFGE